jgi:hypothetical protein
LAGFGSLSNILNLARTFFDERNAAGVSQTFPKIPLRRGGKKKGCGENEFSPRLADKKDFLKWGGGKMQRITEKNKKVVCLTRPPVRTNS